MNAMLKRMMLMSAALLLFPSVAFSYVTVYQTVVDNPVRYGSEGFVVSVQVEVTEGDEWSQTLFSWNSAEYQNICFDHDTFGPGQHVQLFYVPFEDPETADPDAAFSIYTYDESSNGSSCNSSNGYESLPSMFLDISEPIQEFPDVILFGVNKQFRPVSDEEIQVNINCTAGSPGDDSTMMDQDGVHIFPQEFLNPANPNHNCVITEADVPAGYEPVYIMNLNHFYDPPVGNGVASKEGCFFYGSGNMRIENNCMILNLGLPSTFTITKDWEIYQDSDTPFVSLQEQQVMLSAACNSNIISMHVADQGPCMDDDADSDYNGCDFGLDMLVNNTASWLTFGDSSITVTVDNSGYEPAVCEGYEYLRYSNTERVSTTCWEYDPDPTAIEFELTPGGSDGCGFVNTVFFEGIPTLSQYGMALMALLMLGVGFVGFRRFV